MNIERRAELLLVMTTIVAAAGWVFSKEAIQGLPAFGFIGLRFLVAAFCLLPFCWQDLRKISRSDIAQCMAVGCLMAVTILLWISSIAMSDTLGEGAFIMSLSMLFVPLVSWVLFKRRPPRIFWLALPVALLGLTILSFGGGDGWQFSSSQFSFLAAALTLAIHFNVNSKYSRKIPILSLTFLQLFVTGIIGITVSLCFEVWPSSIPSDIWIWFLLSAVVATSLRYVFQTIGQKHVNPANAAIIMILEPVFTVILSVLWYAEEMPQYKVIGCMVILFSLFIYRGSEMMMKYCRRVKKA
ncbi:hypothetical protein BCU68_02890 [Vibrio sp. 10N.286.49.B3]|uniref:DMT family transporter n=1 Tax=Vibrio sp. 10N.286.49.B3 TaxID=1880855 RepID=UPI000C82FE4A|nr:DMT family transporter [Vibrio sp. 10N.286.49.B3]PMH44466.1 hypothetical protein BCU68_02890 [Vibrio sp. 10N.286.49.B3]